MPLRIGTPGTKRKAGPVAEPIPRESLRKSAATRYDRDLDSPEHLRMGIARLAVIAVLPLLLSACGLFDDAPEKPAPPAPPQPAAATPPAPIPLRIPPETLLGFPPSDKKPQPVISPPPPPSPPPAPPSAPAASAKPPANPDTIPEDEAQSFYEGVMLTYAFDACGLPLIGETARQDIGHRIEICPNTEARKSALRTLYRQALAAAERDPQRLRASALALCKDKRAFLSNVMAHSEQLRFDDNRPPDCGLLSPRP